MDEILAVPVALPDDQPVLTAVPDGDAPQPVAEGPLTAPLVDRVFFEAVHGVIDGVEKVL